MRNILAGIALALSFFVQPLAAQTVKNVDLAQIEEDTIVISTAARTLYYKGANGEVLTFDIGVGRDGFTWKGEVVVSKKAEWPDWYPPKEMLAREPWLPRYMPGGRTNPMGARALYLGDTLYRIHGSRASEHWAIGDAVSSGCFRMKNVDIIKLYERVRVGTKVIVLE
jgi:lipoprotein-anchoring transpeptidase ErfK/SrfK